MYLTIHVYPTFSTQDNLLTINNKQILKEQKENVEKTGKISDKYLIP